MSFAVETPHLNDTLPDFSLEDTEGNTHSLLDYRGKIVVLFTFGYNCGWCVQRASGLETIHQDHGGDDLVVMGLDGWNGTNEQVDGFAEASGATFLLLTGAGSYIDNLNTIDDRGTIFILNREGVVVSSCDDGFNSLACFNMQELDSLVEETLAVTTVVLPYPYSPALMNQTYGEADAIAFNAAGRRLQIRGFDSLQRRYVPYILYIK
jgi:peroxiredoxin